MIKNAEVHGGTVDPTCFTNKNVLITGGCGFIGLNLTHELVKSGANVTVLDLPSAKWDRLPLNVNAIKADIMDTSALRHVFDDIEVVFHLAARTDLGGNKLDDYRANFKGTANIIDEMRSSKSIQRLVFYSTILVVGMFDDTRFIDEKEPYRTKTFYGQSKIEAEKIVVNRCESLNITYTIIRPASVYGPWGEEPYRDFFYSIKKHRYFHVGNAKNLVSWVYVKNLVDLTILLSINPEAKNQIYFGTDIHPYTMKEIATRVSDYYGIKTKTIPEPVLTIVAYILEPFRRLGLKVPIYPFRLKNIKANYCYDMQKSISVGYKQRYNLADGLKESLDWYEEMKLL